jgi:hypothetical protein
MTFDTKREYEDFLRMQKTAYIKYQTVIINENNYENLCKIKYVNKYPKFQRIDMLFLKPFSIPIEYKHFLYICDKTGKEIPDDSKVRIRYCKDKIQTYDKARLYYSDVKRTNEKNGFNFNNIIKVNWNYHFMIEIIEPKVDIDIKNIKFEIKVNSWEDFWHP